MRLILNSKNRKQIENNNNYITEIKLLESTSKNENVFFKFPLSCEGTELDEILQTCQFRWLGLDISNDNKYWLNTIQQNDCYKTIDTFCNINSYIWSYKSIDFGYEHFKRLSNICDNKRNQLIDGMCLDEKDIDFLSIFMTRNGNRNR